MNIRLIVVNVVFVYCCCVGWFDSSGYVRSIV